VPKTSAPAYNTEAAALQKRIYPDTSAPDWCFTGEIFIAA
jgi:hypothetical protein